MIPGDHHQTAVISSDLALHAGSEGKEPVCIYCYTTVHSRMVHGQKTESSQAAEPAVWTSQCSLAESVTLSFVNLDSDTNTFNAIAHGSHLIV